MRRGVTYSEVLQGDQVLVQQEKRDNLSSRFDPNPCTVLSKHENRRTENESSIHATPHMPRNYYRTVIHQVHRGNPPNSKVQCRFQMLRNPEFQMLLNPALQLFLNPKIVIRRSKRPRETPNYLKGYYT